MLDDPPLMEKTGLQVEPVRPTERVRNWGFLSAWLYQRFEGLGRAVSYRTVPACIAGCAASTLAARYRSEFSSKSLSRRSTAGVSAAVVMELGKALMAAPVRPFQGEAGVCGFGRCSVSRPPCFGLKTHDSISDHSSSERAM